MDGYGQLYAPLFGSGSMQAVWSDENLVRTWLQVEVAITEALTEVGLVEAAALDEIREAARVEHIDLERLLQGTVAVGMPIKALVEQVVERGGAWTAKYFHWGATTQDILDSGQALRLKASLALLEAQLTDLLGPLVDMADAHRATPMVARTNSQDALPTSWGLQVSTYAAEVVRHLERLEAIRPRAATAMFGGAVGHLAALGDRGLEVRDRVAALLGLTTPRGAWNASQDRVVEVLQLCALIAGTLVRTANDVETMGRTSIRELRRRSAEGASSTMPHKTNPRDANMIQTHFQLITMYAGQAPHLMDQVDVRSAAKRVVGWKIVPDSLMATSAAIERAQAMIGQLVVDEDQMLASFEDSRGFVMSESVMFVLAEKIGRDEAYTAVQAALRVAPPDASLLDVLGASPEIRAHLSEAELAEACRPDRYLGCTDGLIDEVIAAARRYRSS